MDPNIAQNEPVVIIKPITPFYRSVKFLTGIGSLLLILVSFGIYNMFQKYTTPSKVAEIAQEESTKPLKGLIGTVLAVDREKSMITVKAKEKDQSYPVSNDVLISQIVLGIRSEKEDMKQFTLPTDILYLEDLEKKKGEEVYLVFDQNGKNVVQIQMYPNK